MNNQLHTAERTGFCVTVRLMSQDGLTVLDTFDDIENEFISKDGAFGRLVELYCADSDCLYNTDHILGESTADGSRDLIVTMFGMRVWRRYDVQQFTVRGMPTLL